MPDGNRTKKYPVMKEAFPATRCHYHGRMNLSRKRLVKRKNIPFEFFIKPLMGKDHLYYVSGHALRRFLKHKPGQKKESAGSHFTNSSLRPESKKMN